MMRNPRGTVGALVLVWLLVGALAAWQRGYFSNSASNCPQAGTISLTVVAGPLNYLGVNPRVTDCTLPKPSGQPRSGLSGNAVNNDGSRA